MSGRYPGSADLEAFWSLLAEGRCAVRDIPPERWDIERHYDPVRMYCRSMGVLDDVESFDPTFFRIPPADARFIDPQHRLFMQEAYRAFEDAGMAPSSLAGSRCGVYLGIMSNEYGLLLSREQGAAGASLLNHFSIGAARIAYHLDLKGPAVPVDTACSSSAVAAHLACQALRSGEIDMALVGGVTLYLAPEAYSSMCTAGMLSPDGLCKTFDQDANGFVPGEGVGALVLKRLSAAEAAGDDILGLIVASGINQDGRSNGMTAPNAASQTDLVTDIYTRFGIEPRSIQYAEMHGTGTRLGDPVELGALAAAFRRSTDDREFCAIGSVKTNIGHTSAAAGVASIQKVLLSLRHGQLPPTLHYRRPNEHFDFASSPFVVNTQLRPWPTSDEGPRRATVSSFGFSGTNAHLVIEEYLGGGRAPAASVSDEVAHLFVWSARSEEQLVESLVAHRRAITQAPVDLEAMSLTLQCGRDSFPVRFAACATSTDALVCEIDLRLTRGVPSAPAAAGVLDRKDIERMWREGRLRELADYWMSGHDLDWRTLRGGGRRMHLPTYRFKRQRHWLAPTSAGIRLDLVERHPDTLLFRTRLDGTEPTIADHRVSGERIVAGVVCLGLAHKAVRCSGWAQVDLQAVSLTDVEWPESCAASADGVVLSIQVTRSAGMVRVAVTDESGRTVYCRAQANWEEVTVHPPVDLDAMCQFGDGRSVIEGETLYEWFHSAGLDYGPSHRLVSRLVIDDDGVWASLRPSPPSATSDLPSPGHLDAALQCVAGLVLGSPSRKDGRARLPAGVKRFEVTGAPDAARWVRVRLAQRNRVDVWLFDSQGQPVGVFHGMSFTGSSTEKALVFTPIWEPAGDVRLTHAAGLVLLAGVRSDAADVLARESGAREIIMVNIHDGYAAAAWTLIGRIQTIGERGASITLVLGPDATALGMAGLAGLAKAAMLERPSLRIAVVEASAEDVASADALRAVLSIGEGRSGRFRHRRGVFWRETFTPLDRPTSVASPWRDDGVYWIAGGAGGLGSALADEILASAPHARILLTGRSTSPTSLDEALSRWHSVGARVSYSALDVTDAVAVDAFAADAVRREGGITGVFHLAGVTQDSLLQAKDSQGVRRVLAPKIEGARNLDCATRDQPLAHFVMFSSIAGVMGNVGQCDYAAANAFLHAFAHERERRRRTGERHGTTCAIAWPLWLARGMQPSQEVIDGLRDAGIEPMPVETGMRILREALEAQWNDVGVMYGTSELASRLMHFAPVSKEPHAVAAGTRDEATILKATMDHLRRIVADTFQLEPSAMHDAADFGDYGIDSVLSVRLTRRLETEFGPLSKSLLFEYRRLPELASFFLATYPNVCARLAGTSPVTGSGSPAAPTFDAGRHTHASGPAGADDAIAIIGIAGRFPKAVDLSEFWNNLAEGRDSVGEIPSSRWDHARYYNAEPGVLGKTYCRRGGFIDGVYEFDSLFFNISPNEAVVMDPQERLFLQCAYQAMENAGYCRANLADDGRDVGRDVGVYVGVMYHEYPFFGVERGVRQTPIALGGNAASIANRVSFVLDLHGPSMAVDTMCSSSLTALELACQSVRSGRCHMAIAGGVNLNLHPNKFLGLAQGRFASRAGHCSSFGAEGDGYVPAEGVAAVVIKRLADARRDGDHIHGVIRGITVNHGGKTTAFTVPNPVAQAAVIESAYRQAGIEPETIGYVEAHGTGTALGDPIEIAGLTKAFRTFTERTGFCAIGSVKSNIGHGESVAGMAALAKVLLQMKHGRIAPSLHASEANPHIDFSRTPFVLQKELVDWPRIPVDDASGPFHQLPRRAGISSFGAGGANAHVIVEEYIDAPRPVRSTSPQVVVLSAREAERLRDLVSRMRAFLDGEDTPHLADLAFTLQQGREHWEYRVAFLVESIPSLRAALSAWLDGEPVPVPCMQGSCLATGVSKRSHDGVPASLHEAMALWVRGKDVNWTALDPFLRVRRIAAPTYPFARTLHVLPPVPESRTADPVPQAEHRFLREGSADFRSRHFHAVLDPADPLLLDHRVGGNAVAAGTLQLELVAAAAQRMVDEAGRGAVLRLADVAWMRPLYVESTVSVRVGFVATSSHAASWTLFGDDELAPFSCGEVAFVDLLRPAAVDPLSLRQRCTRGTVDGDALDAAYESIGIQYGPAYRAIESVWIGEGEAVARLVAPSSSLASEHAISLPFVLIDAACRTMVTLSAKDGALAMPFSLDACEIHRMASGALWAHLRMRPGDPARQVMQADVDLYDDSGELCVSLRGLSTRRSAQQQPIDEVVDDKHDILLAPRWYVVDGQHLYLESDPPDVVIGGSATQRDRWCARYPGAIALAQEQLDQGQGRDVLTRAGRLVWLAPAIDTSSCGIASAATDSVLACLRLVSAMMAAGLDRRPVDVWLVTSHAAATCAREHFDATHAGIFGLAGTLAKEMPRWHLRVADVDAQGAEDCARILGLPASPSGDTRLLRDGQWLASRLEPVEPDAAAGNAFRRGAVYVLIGGAGGIGGVFSEYLVRNYDAQIVWIGRRTADEAIARSVARIGQEGRRPLYIQADAADPGALAEACASVRARFGAIHGIVHGALVLGDGALSRMDEQRFRSAWMPKAGVAAALAQVARGIEELDFLLFFSSFNAFTRQAGQGNYAAGCTFADSLAHNLDACLDCSVRVINWGFWGSVGAVATEAYRQRMAAMGIGSIEPAPAMAAIEYLLSGPHRQLAMVNGSRAILPPALRTSANTPSTPSPPAMEASPSMPDLPSRKTISNERHRERIVGQVRDIVGQTLGIDPEQIDTQHTLDRYGIDSITVVQVTNRLRETFGEASNTLLFEHTTIDALAMHFAASSAATQSGDVAVPALAATVELDSRIWPPIPSNASRVPRAMQAIDDAPMAVAVIGLSGRYPLADDIHAFWDGLMQGRNLIREIPPERSALLGSIPDGVPRWGGFLDRIDAFDPLFFQISMREAEALDPQERLFLQEAHACIEDAGYSPAALGASGSVGVYVGVMNGNYPTGTRHWSVANRVSHALGFNGPSFAVDTACSSSLSATHLALQALGDGSIDCALVGGVNLITSVEHLRRLDAMNMLSASSQVRAFGAGADGFVAGEAVGAMLLKPLARALADGDDIYGLLLGSAVNSGGHTPGYTVPNPIAQGEAIREAYRRSGIVPRQVSYVEAHGTGTTLGDPIEVRGLTMAFGTADRQFCALGSVKTNMGHAESAAGIAGLTKVLLQLRHRTLVSSLHAATANPDIDFSSTPFFLQRETTYWTAPPGTKRIASVSSFGAGGANAVVVVAEHEDRRPPPIIEEPSVIVLSACDEAALVAQAGRLRVAAERSRMEPGWLARAAFTLQTGRREFDIRMAVTVDHVDALIEALRGFELRRGDVLGIHTGASRRRVGEATFDAGHVRRLVEDGAFDEIARAWVSGSTVEWRGLYARTLPGRVHLPAYPFSDERFWASVVNARTQTGVAAQSIPKRAADPASALPELDAWFDVLQSRGADATQHGEHHLTLLRSVIAARSRVDINAIDGDMTLDDVGLGPGDIGVLVPDIVVAFELNDDAANLVAAHCTASATLRELAALLEKHCDTERV
jgi:acyl transferase domain-containing protein/NADP-dependent 3-hydroxy acid dehydrogenase YdfG/acyl carrier protein